MQIALRLPFKKMKTDSKHVPQLLKPGEVAGLLGIGKSSVYRLADRRILPFFKIGGSIRFSEEDVASLLEQNRFGAVDLKMYGSKKN